MIGKLTGVQRLFGGDWSLTFSTREDASKIYDELAGKEVNIEIKKHSKRRSLTANGYAWVIIDKIAEKTGLKKTEVYRNAIKEIGGVSETVCVQDKAVDRLRECWEKNGIGWQSDTIKSKIDGCTNVILYYGSSVYDSKQMAQLIDSLVQDAESLGIPTISEREMEKMLGSWGKQK